AQHAQHVVLALGEVAVDLLEGEDSAGDAHEADHVSGDASRKRGEHLLRPLLQRRLPGQVQQGRICTGRGDLQGCHEAILSRGGAEVSLWPRFHVMSTRGSPLARAGDGWTTATGARQKPDARRDAKSISRRGARPSSCRTGAGDPPWGG